MTAVNENLTAIAAFLSGIFPEVKYELLNYNPLAEAKYRNTDREYCFSEEDKQAICEDTPAGRLGRPEEIAEMLFFLQSEKAAFITGQIIGVNGGYLI